jgi:cytochrome c peroxidase
MNKGVVFFILLSVFSIAFISPSETEFKKPENFPKPKYNFKNNPFDSNKINIGRALFYDPILSKDSSISCASCHSNYTAFTHVDHALSHGIADRIGFRNAPGLMNLAWHENFMWDGAINNLEMQALAPLTNHLEMDENLNHVLEKLNRSVFYKNLFKQAYGDEIISTDRFLKSITQFLLQMVSASAKYDSVKNGSATFTAQEKKGYHIFKKNCATCHTEPLFTNLKFEQNNLPVDPNLKDMGRMRITQSAKDSICFKVPTLRNIAFTFPYMHDGRMGKLQDVLHHYENIQLLTSNNKRIKIRLNKAEKVDLTAFLLTLTDQQFLFNPALAFPKELLLLNRRKNE